jgi:hypothetical protein
VDGDPVSPEEPSKPITLNEFFRAMFPKYMALGMTYDEFWEGPAWLVRSYREAAELKRAQRNWEMWMQAAYVYDTLLRVSPVFRPFGKGEVKPADFMEAPYPLTEKEAKEREEARERKNFFEYLARMESDSERELKRRAEQAKKEVSKDG